MGADIYFPSGHSRLDDALGGGVPYSFKGPNLRVEINGDRGTGKSTLAYKLLSYAHDNTGLEVVTVAPNQRYFAHVSVGDCVSMSQAERLYYGKSYQLVVCDECEVVLPTAREALPWLLIVVGQPPSVGSGANLLSFTTRVTQGRFECDMTLPTGERVSSDVLPTRSVYDDLLDDL